MGIELKQSTATTILFGPFLDSGDGVTAETGLATAMDNATTGIRLSKNGGNMADRNSSTAPTHDEDGFYNVHLDATDTNTLGLLQIEYSDGTTNTPLRMDLAIVTANYWDTKYGADQFDVNVTNIIGTAPTLTNNDLDVNVTQINGQTQVNPGAANGLVIAGTNAPITFTGAGHAMTLQSTGSNGAGLLCVANGTGSGIQGQGGATGHGLNFLSAGTGDGIRSIGGSASGATPAGHGMRLIGGQGSTTSGGAAGQGLSTNGGDSATSTNIAGRGITATAGNDNGAGGNAGMRIQAVGPADEHGLVCAATGTGSGIAALSGNGATGNGILAQATSTNGDGLRLIGTGTGQDINAAEIDTIDANVDSILVDTGTTLDGKLNDIQGAGFVTGTDSLEAIRDRGDAAWITGAGGSDRLLMVDTTIATLSTQTEFTLTAGSADNDAYNNCTIIVEDVSTSTQKAVGMVLDYVGSTRTVTLKEALAFTIATTDKVYILAENSLKSTVANRQLDVTATGAAGIDWANVENPATAVDLSATDIQLCDTVTTNSDMRGTDSAALASVCTEARLSELDEATAGKMANQVDIIQTDTTTDIPAQISALNDVAATDIVSAGAITTLSGAVVNVDTVDTCTTNSDMRGTDSAALASVCTEARLSELDAATSGKMANQVDIIQTDTTTDIPATITTLQSDTDDIQTRLPAALVSGRIDASVGAMATDVLTAAALNADAVDEIRDGVLPTQNSAFNNIMFLFVAASDGRTPVTGATGTGVTRSIDGGAFGAGTGTLAEIGNGIYQYDASAADMNGGIITFRFTGTGGTPGAPDDRFVTVVTGGGV